MTTHDCTARELVEGALAGPGGELAGVLTDSDTGIELHRQVASVPDRVERALDAADRAHRDGAWAELPPAERAAALRRLQTELAARVDQVARADSTDTGVPLTTTTAFFTGVVGVLELAAEEVEAGFGHVEVASESGGCDQWRLPWGPAAVFLPWNAPANIAVVRVTDALVAGCPVVLKPSEWAPHSSGPLAEAFAAALPPGVVQVVHGGADVGQALVSDPRVAAVSYTGGLAGGTAVAEACARQLKPVDLELSGNNPAVVLPGADSMEVAQHVVAALLTLNGQYCVGPRRLVVAEDDVVRVVDALAEVLDSIAIGATYEPSTRLGPMAHEQHRQRLEEQLEEFERRGCEVRRYGRLPESGGHFVAPAVVLADKAPELKDEVFGPVLQVRTYRDLDEAVAIANDHAFGLSAYVFGDRQEARVLGRRLRAGIVRLNSPYGPPDVSPVGAPWGRSGLGQFGLGEGARFFTGARFVG